jgi:hypothetical protein
VDGDDERGDSLLEAERELPADGVVATPAGSELWRLTDGTVSDAAATTGEEATAPLAAAAATAEGPRLVDGGSTAGSSPEDRGDGVGLAAGTAVSLLSPSASASSAPFLIQGWLSMSRMLNLSSGFGVRMRLSRSLASALNHAGYTKSA